MCRRWRIASCAASCKQEMKGIIRMKRADDFEVRRQHIANLTDEELYQRFWESWERRIRHLP